MTVHCYTSATFAYLDRARVLGQTIRTHHPDWHFTLCLPDEAPPGVTLDFADEPFDDVLLMQELDLPDLGPWIFQHDIVELCTAVKGAAMVHLLDKGADKVVYLDPDIAIMSPLDEVVHMLDEHDVVLTPHLLQPATERLEILDNEIAALKHGVYNLGFAAVASRHEGRRFAEWWRDRLTDFCVDDVPNGLFTDQRWCDLAPAFFPTLGILRHPGYNVASWNLGQRALTFDASGELLAAGEPLRFFHFTKVTREGEKMIERYARESTVPIELMRWYRAQLDLAGVDGLEPDWWAYGTYDDGERIPRSHRRAYRESPKLRAQHPEPFASAAPFEALLG